MNRSQPPRKDEAADGFVRGLVAEDLPACIAFLDSLADRSDAAAQFARALDDSEAAWAAEIVNELGKYVNEHYGERRARSYYELALAAGI